MTPLLSKRERSRKIKQIYRDMEAKKRTLGLRAPTLRKGPMFYMVVLIGMALLGGALIQMSGKADALGLGGRKLRDGRPVMAQKSVDAVAEALGRFKFHTGVYPSVAEGGIEALAVKYSDRAGWVGPYLHKDNPYKKIAIDPWKRPYIYEPPVGTNVLPTTSCRTRPFSRRRSATPHGRTTGCRSRSAESSSNEELHFSFYILHSQPMVVEYG